MGLWDKMRDHLVESDENDIKQARSPVDPQLKPNSYMNSYLPPSDQTVNVGISQFTHVNGQSEIYSALAKQTAPETTALAALFENAAKLETTLADRRLRFRAALKVCGIPPDAVAGAINELKAKLEYENQRFHEGAKKARAEQVNSAEHGIEELKTKVEAMQRDIADRSAAIETARSKIAQREAEFAAAHARRADELQQLEKELTAL